MPRGIQFQERDLALLMDLVDSGLMTARHAAAFHFHGRLHAARKRLQLLTAAGVISIRRRAPNEPGLWSATSKAVRILRQHGVSIKDSRRRLIGAVALDHDLAVLDVKAAFHGACRKNEDTAIKEFRTNPERLAFRGFHEGKRFWVKPDGCIRLETRPALGARSLHFFLEVDRSTETIDVLVRRVLCYRHYYKRSGFARRLGVPPTEYKRHPFRMLIVCKSILRRNILAAAFAQCRPPIRNFAYLATHAEVTRNPLASIWITPRLHELNEKRASSVQPFATGLL